MDDKTFVTPRWFPALFLITSVLLVVNGIFFHRVLPIALTCIVVGMVAGLFAAAQLYRPDRLQLSSEGLVLTRRFGRSVDLHWSDVDIFFSYRPSYARSGTIAAFRYSSDSTKDTAESRKPRASANRIDGVIGGVWPISAVDLVSLLNEYRIRSIRPLLEIDGAGFYENKHPSWESELSTTSSDKSRLARVYKAGDDYRVMRFRRGSVQTWDGEWWREDSMLRPSITDTLMRAREMAEDYVDDHGVNA